MPPGQQVHLTPRGPVSHSTPTNGHTTSMNKQRSDHRKTGKLSTAASKDRLHSHANKQRATLPGSHTPTGRTVRVVLRNAPAVPRSHSGERLKARMPTARLSLFITVSRDGVTGITHYRPSAKLLSQLLYSVIKKSVDGSPPPSTSP